MKIKCGREAYGFRWLEIAICFGHDELKQALISSPVSSSPWRSDLEGKIRDLSVSPLIYRER